MPRSGLRRSAATGEWRDWDVLSRGGLPRLGVRFVLVHSPLVGPATWRGVADVLVSFGHQVELPDLRDAAQSGDPRRFISVARSATSTDTAVLVGHSGAGFFLPSIA